MKNKKRTYSRKKQYTGSMAHRKLVSALGMTALSMAIVAAAETVASTDSTAASLANEKAMAGFSLTLEKCYDSATAEEAAQINVALADTVRGKSGTDVVAVNEKTPEEQEEQKEQKAMEQTGAEADDSIESDHVSVKDLLSNINYGRLGIADVDNYLNIRKKPGEDGKIVGKLTKNAGCHIYKIKNGWAKIISNGVKGWVSADYLITDEEAEAYAMTVATKVATVETENLRARFLPSTDSSIYTLIAEGEDLHVVKENLTKAYVEKVIENNFKKEDKRLIENVDRESMYQDLDNWLCVKLNGEKIFISKDYVKISYQLKKAVAIDESNYSSEETGISSVRSQMVSYAMQFLGNPYVWGGTSLTYGCDCSGFVMGIYAHFGYGLPRVSASQAASMTGIDYSEAQPGDLFFYGNGYRVSHVAMYIGGGQIIHAMDESHGICISNAFYMTPMKIGRMID